MYVKVFGLAIEKDYKAVLDWGEGVKIIENV